MRPDKLETIIGQDDAKAQIQLALDGATARNGALPHMLFTGKPGTGKTTLARAIAGERGTKCIDIVASAIVSEIMLVNILMQLDIGDVLFFDELHNLPEKYGDIMYPVMEDFKLSLPLGYHMVDMPLPEFTFIGATNRVDDIEKPFLDRFGLVVRLEGYTLEQMALIAKMNSDVPIDDDAAIQIASIGRGVPRITVKQVERVLDYVSKKKLTRVNLEAVQEVMKILKINKFGLTPLDMRMLSAMFVIFSGKPAGIKAIATAIDESQKTIEEQVEPYLIQKQYITRMHNGRVLTEKGLLVLKEMKMLHSMGAMYE